MVASKATPALLLGLEVLGVRSCVQAGYCESLHTPDGNK